MTQEPIWLRLRLRVPPGGEGAWGKETPYVTTAGHDDSGPFDYHCEAYPDGVLEIRGVERTAPDVQNATRTARRGWTRWACRATAVFGAVSGVALLVAGQAPMECVALEQASLVFAVLSLRP